MVNDAAKWAILTAIFHPCNCNGEPCSACRNWVKLAIYKKPVGQQRSSHPSLLRNSVVYVHVSYINNTNFFTEIVNKVLAFQKFSPEMTSTAFCMFTTYWQ
jgi:hypothetical protein